MNKSESNGIDSSSMTEELSNLFDICSMNLKNSQKCKDYLTKDRMLSEQAISTFKIGFFPQNINTLTKYISPDVLKKVAIIDYSERSQFSDFFYLVFPIYSEYGDAEAISGRTLLKDIEREALDIPKYKNSMYKKSNNVYGLNIARSEIVERQNAYVVEGQIDAITMHDNGFKNTVAICGASFSKRHFLSMAKYTDKLTFIMDNDQPGQIAASNIKKKYSNRGISIRFLKPPDNIKDINEYFVKNKTNKNFLNDFKLFDPGL